MRCGVVRAVCVRYRCAVSRLNTCVPLLLPLLLPQVSKIMLAAGTDLAPFWRIYRQHLNSELPRQLLAGMQVGSPTYFAPL